MVFYSRSRSPQRRDRSIERTEKRRVSPSPSPSPSPSKERKRSVTPDDRSPQERGSLSPRRRSRTPVGDSPVAENGLSNRSPVNDDYDDRNGSPRGSSESA